MISRRLQQSEAWVLNSYAALPADLAVFRIIYASYLLAKMVPVAAWLPDAPQAFYGPPIGLAAFFAAAPPEPVLIGLNLLLSLFAAMLLIGWRTGLASFGTGLTLIVLNSWAYSLGKINHDILLVVAPLVLAFSTWGSAFSVDAARQSPEPGEQRGSVHLTLLAVLVGSAMFTAGWAKASTGWLDPDLRCTYGYLVRNFVFTGRDTWAAALTMRVDAGWFWKLMDWATVALEVLMLPAVIHRRAFQVFLAAAAFFHLGVLLLFDIPFAANLIVYAAFVPWTQVPLLRRLGNRALQLSTRTALITFATMSGMAAAATFSGKAADSVLPVPMDRAVVYLGAMFAVGYVLWTLARAGRRTPRLSPPIQSDHPGSPE